MPTAFGAFLLSIMDQRRLTQRSFGKLIGMSQGNLSKIINGHPKTPGPPLDKLDQWAEHLALIGPDRERFLDLGWRSHLSARAVAWLDSVREDLSKAKAEIDSLRSELAQVASERDEIASERDGLADDIADLQSKIDEIELRMRYGDTDGPR